MFRKKNKSPLVAVRQSQRPNPLASATPDAINAAALAAIKQQQSNSTLSSAAAAAALRSLTSSPVPVGEIQTKRMIRKGSTSSYGSGAGGSTRPGLQRQNSSSSMTERTFRSPSPSTRTAPPVPKQPVPPLPRAPPIPQKSHKRASSLDPSSPRVASPPPTTSPASRPVVTTPKQQQSPASVAARLSALGAQGAKASPVQQSSRPGSVNFSRPISPTPSPSAVKASPRGAAPPAQNMRGGVPARPATSLGFSSTDTRSVEQSIKKAAKQPVKTKKVTAAAEGSHFANNVVANSTTNRDETASTKASALVAAAKVAQNQATTSPKASPASKSVPKINTTNVSASKPLQAKPAATSKAQITAPLTTPSPSKAQIESFQARAAAMTARPRSSPADAMKDEAAKMSLANKAENIVVSAPVPPTSAVAAKPSVSAAPVASKKITSMEGLPKQHVRSASSPIEGGVALAPNVVRTASISPARSAHFSEKPVVEASLHKPPARAVSPMKSALKPSSRTASPAGSSTRGSRDASETRSDDGSVPSSKKKRSAKVSFDEEPVTVGQAATPLSPDSPMIISPQNKVSTTPWSESESSGMSPRPALPSFGSVRGRKDDLDEAKTPLKQILATNATPHVDTTSRDGPASDGAVNESTTSATAGAASVLLPSIAVLPATPRLEDDEKDFGTSASIAQKLADGEHPEPIGSFAVNNAASPTSLEAHRDSYDEAGSGSESDGAELYSDAAEDQDEDTGEQFASLNAILESPIAEEAPPLDSAAADIPTSAIVSQTAVPLATTAAAAASTETPGTDWDEARKYWSSLSEQKKEQMEAESVPVPLTTDKTVSAVKKAPKKKNLSMSSIPSQPSSAPHPPLPPWPDKQYQNSVKKSGPVQASERAPTKPPASDKPQMRKSMRSAAAPPTPVVESTHMRKSMRSGGTLEPSARQPFQKSRDAPRPVSTYSAPKSKAQNGPRPTSAPVAASDAVVLARAIAAKQAAYTPTPTSRKPKTSRLGRSGSNASNESESSFRKRRSSVSSADGTRYSMKRSMRGAPPVPNQRPMSPMSSSKGKLSLRPMSPSGSSVNSQKWYSKRDSIDSDVFSIGSNPDKEKKSRFGFRKSKPKASKAPSAGSRFSSRFADSSDEDEGSRPTRFRSRFVDSDDEDDFPSPVIPLPQKLTPVRGIPRKFGQEDAESTDLEDSDDEVVPARVPVTETPATIPPHANGTVQGPAPSPSTLRKSESPIVTKPAKTKRGFFGFGKKEKIPAAPSSPQPIPTPTKMHRMSAFGSASPSVQTSPQSQTAAGSMLPPINTESSPAADTGLGESQTSPSVVRPSTPSRSAKLLHRLSGSPNTDIPPRSEWPAPPPIPDSPPRLPALDWDRPSTSDGIPASKTVSASDFDSGARPPIGNKRISSMTIPAVMPSSITKTDQPVVVSSRTGKKKKFQGLRRAFGLID